MTYVIHRGFTLHDLLLSLRAANPEWTINLGTSVHSYRGFYEHIAVAPGPHDKNRVREVSPILGEVDDRYFRDPEDWDFWEGGFC